MDTESHTHFRHVLVILSESYEGELERAVQYADACAKANFPIRVTLLKSFYKKFEGLKADDKNTPDDMGAFAKMQQEAIAKRYNQMTEYDHQLDIIISWRHPVIERITQLVKDQDIDLVIKAPDKVKKLTDVFTSTIEKFLVRDCLAAVWLVKSRQWDSHTEFLTCLDVDDDTDQNIQLNHHILSTGRWLSELYRAEHHTIDCFFGERVAIHANYNADTGFEKFQSIHKEHLHKLKDYAADYFIPIDQIHCVAGMPDDEIPNISRQLKAEMVIIGNNHDNLIKRTFGDTAIILSDNVPCDILVLKLSNLDES